MTPLDLTVRAPRPCRFELDGIPFLARAIDKVRGEMPGGNPGAYFTVHDSIATMSAFFYARLRITHDQFSTEVRAAADDEAVVAWLRAHVEPQAIERYTSILLALRLADLPAAGLAVVRKLYPDANDADPSTLMIDIIDRDDVASFRR